MENAHQVIYSKITFSHSRISFANEVVKCDKSHMKSHAYLHTLSETKINSCDHTC